MDPDPVRVDAAAGDTLETTVEVSGTAPVLFVSVVPARRRPTVVRTIPPRRKADVPLNARVVIVFSEPIDSQTVSATAIRIVSGSTSVPAQVSVSDAAGLVVELIPATLLGLGTTYQIVVGDGIRDRDGDALEAPFVSEFTTGSSVAVAGIATYQTALFVAPNGESRTFEMSAVLDENGTVTGRFSIFYPGTGGRAGGRVTCFTILEARTAWIAGVIEDVGSGAAIGHTMGWRVVDNGHPDDGLPDQLSFAHPIGSSQETSGDFCASTPTFDGNQEEIALYELVSGNIVIADAEGSPPPPPPPVTGMSQIAFAAFPNGGIRVMRADGLGSRALTSSAGDWNPAWSPDGSRIAFDRGTNTEMGPDIYVMNADGSGLQPLTSGPSFDAHPTWSPDGGRIAFYRNGSIHVMNASGSGVTKLTDDGQYPAWSPNGARIAFWSGRSGQRGVYVMNVDGSDIRQLTSDTIDASNPSWSPDGSSIAFQGSAGIYIMSADGANVRRVALGGQTPTWSPDGSMILYEWFGLNVINVDGSGLTRRGSGFTPSWSRAGTMPPPPEPFAMISVAGGDGQTDTVHATLAQRLRVRVARTDGTAVNGVPVNFFMPGGSPDFRPSLSSNSAVTDSDGIASVALTFGAVAGPVIVQARVTNGTALTPGVVFTATAKAGNPVTFARYGVDSLITTVNSLVEYALSMRDSHGSCQSGCGNFVSAVPITWAVTAGGGTIAPAQDTIAYDGTPIMRAVHTLGMDEGTSTVTATASTIPGAPRLTFTSTAITTIVVVEWGAFSPDSVVVPLGRTVGWRWNPGGDSDDVHTVTFEDDPSQPVSSGSHYYGFHTRRFDGSPRTVRYRCLLHTTSFAYGEVGVVIVR